MHQQSAGLAVRPAHAGDIDRVMALVTDCVQDMRTRGIDQWDEIYPDRLTFTADAQRGTLYLADDAIAPLAGAVVLDDRQNAEYAQVPWSILTDRVGVVHRLMVHPRVQQKGLARALMAFVEDRARGLGYEAIRLDAFTLNPRALALYTALGYRDAGPVRFRKGLFRCFEKRLE